MSDYTLYYWSVPFRGQFVRAVLTYADLTFDERGDDEIAALMEKPPQEQPIAFMGPPVLVDNQSGFALAQMPAILFYLAERHGLLPETIEGKVQALKVVQDCNDVIDEITQDGGREMWTTASWRAFEPRLRKWMGIFEATGLRHGLAAGSGHLLGGATPGVADIAVATLWSTLASRFPRIGEMLAETAPATQELVQRIADLSPLQRLQAETDAKWPDSYCGGQIGASLQKVLNG